jgi:hypothetical protein
MVVGGEDRDVRWRRWFGRGEKRGERGRGEGRAGAVGRDEGEGEMGRKVEGG